MTAAWTLANSAAAYNSAVAPRRTYTPVPTNQALMASALAGGATGAPVPGGPSPTGDSSLAPAPAPQSQNLPLPAPGRQQQLAAMLQNEVKPDYTTVRSPLEGLAKVGTSALQGYDLRQYTQGNAANMQALAGMLAPPGADASVNPKAQQLSQLLMSGTVDPSSLAPLALARAGVGGMTIHPPNIAGISLVSDPSGQVVGSYDLQGRFMSTQGDGGVGAGPGGGQGPAGPMPSQGGGGPAPVATGGGVGAPSAATGSASPAPSTAPGQQITWGPPPDFGYQQGTTATGVPVQRDVISGKIEAAAGDPTGQANVLSSDLNSKSANYFAVRDASRGFLAAVPQANQPITGPSAAALVANFARAINPNTVLKAGDTLDPGTIAAASSSGFTDTMMSELNKALTGKGGISTDTINAMKATVGGSYKAALNGQQALEGVYKPFEAQLGVPAGTIVKPSDAGFKWPEPPPAAAPPPITGVSAGPVPAGITPQEWSVMSPQERALFNPVAPTPQTAAPVQANAAGGPWVPRPGASLPVQQLPPPRNPMQAYPPGSY
jgi:hypothetical protein